MDSLPNTMEVPEYLAQQTSPNTGIRCIQSGVGHNIYQLEHFNRWCLGNPGGEVTHQLHRAPSSLVQPAVLCCESEKRTCTSQNRQHSSSSPHKQNGRSPLTIPLQLGFRDVGLVPISESDNLRRTSTRDYESPHRQRIEDRVRLLRMATGQPDLPKADGGEAHVQWTYMPHASRRSHQHITVGGPTWEQQQWIPSPSARTLQGAMPSLPSA